MLIAQLAIRQVTINAQLVVLDIALLITHVYKANRETSQIVKPIIPRTIHYALHAVQTIYLTSKEHCANPVPLLWPIVQLVIRQEIICAVHVLLAIVYRATNVYRISRVTLLIVKPITPPTALIARYVIRTIF